MAIAIVTLTDPRDITNSTVNNEGMTISLWTDIFGCPGSSPKY
jgi:hypothetical protein